MLFNEPKLLKLRKYINDRDEALDGFSALQRAEIAEITFELPNLFMATRVSVLFNEPKLLKSVKQNKSATRQDSFSALQRAEIAEMTQVKFFGDN